MLSSSIAIDHLKLMRILGFDSELATFLEDAVYLYDLKFTLYSGGVINVKRIAE